MDSPHSDDERLQQADAGKELLSKKMKLLIIMLSLVIIILLLPLASDHGLPLLKPMGITMAQRLWDAMRFIAMTAAISVGIISTSSQRNEGGSSRSAHLRSHRSTTPIASSSREPVNPNMSNKFDMPDLSVDRAGVHESLHETTGGMSKMGSSRKSKGKEVMDDFSTAPSKSDDFSTAPSTSDTFPTYASREEESGLERSPAHHVPSQRTPSQASGNFENLKPRPTNSRRQLSASDEWFLALRIDEEMEEEGKSAHAMAGRPVGASQKKPASTSDKGPYMSNKEIKSADHRGAYANYMTDDNYAELRMRKAALSRRLAAESEDASYGKGHHRRSSSVDRRRPIHYDDQGPDRPGLQQILMNASKERASQGKLPNSSLNVKEQLDRPHSAHTSISSNPNAVSASSSQQSSTGTQRSESRRINMGANQILQKQSDSEHARGAVNRTDDYRATNQIRQSQDQAIKNHNQRMQENTRFHQTAQRCDDHQAMVDSAQLKQKQDDHQARMEINQKPLKQADTKTAIAQSLQQSDARMGPHRDNLQSTVHKPNLSSRSKLLLQSSKHSRSDLNLEQLEPKVDTVRVTPPGAAKSYERRKSFSYDFGDGFNPEMLWKLAPPPPPGFIDEQSVRTCPNREADRSSFVSATPKPNEVSDTFVQGLVPWRDSAPIDFSAYPPRTPSPLDPLSQDTGPSSSEVNRRAEEFINKFTNKLLRQRQESMERRRQSG